MTIEEICKILGKEIPKDQKEELEIIKEIFHKEGKETEKGEYDFGEVKGKITKEYKNSDKKIIQISIKLLDEKFEPYQKKGKFVKVDRGNKKVTYKNSKENESFCKKGEFISAKLCYNPRTKQIYVWNLYKISPFKAIRNKMEKQRYHVNTKVLAQFLCAMNTGHIIILHGAPGMGKTSFVRNIATALGEECRMIPVRPNWIDNQDLTGYFNPVEHRYYSTPFLDALCEAKENPDKTYFICLDEMNLAHVEYYFSDVLSAMEEEQKTIPLYSERDYEDAMRRIEHMQKIYEKDSIKWLDAQIDKENLERCQPNFKLPDNVIFVGTLNMDETTNDLSPKVIDRSCIIKVTKADAQELRKKEEGELTQEEARLFEKQLLELLGKMTSNRVERQRQAMIIQRKILNEHLSDADFQDMFMVMKVLPSLNIEEVDQIVEEHKELVKNFEIEEVKNKWKKLYPLTMQYLKEMWDEEEQVLNYWRMNE